jgi:hypothetical protein
MNDFTGAGPAGQRNELSRSLRPRHVSMITVGGIIGAGLFVGSSVAPIQVGSCLRSNRSARRISAWKRTKEPGKSSS